MPRDIEDLLLFRQDISPFLVHLTRNVGVASSAASILEKIILERRLEAGNTDVSDVRFGGRTYDWVDEDVRRSFLSAVCFSETPLAEVHCMLEVANRSVELQPYGLVFLKNRLEARGVAPVVYLNNTAGNMDVVARALFGLGTSDPDAARCLLPLISVFGRKLQHPHAAPAVGNVDWRWEREWRLPRALAPLNIEAGDVFVGLCPHDEIAKFEAQFPEVEFIDPRRNMRWYAQKLIAARQRLDLKYSVV